MIDKKNPTNIELLRIARDLAYSDYNNRKADLHNQWLRESEYMWRTKKLKVSYPLIPPFPSESDILLRAEKLLEFIKRSRPDLSEVKTPNIVQGSNIVSEQPIEQEAPAENATPTEPTVNENNIEQEQNIDVTDKKDNGIMPSVKNFFKF